MALGKPANQSTIGDTPASNAVNGDYSDFSYASQLGEVWWTVDLQTKHSIGSVELYIISNSPGALYLTLAGLS